MLDQSFSAENFRKIFDYENRKGNYLEGKFFPSLEALTNEIKNNAKCIRELGKNKTTLNSVDYQNQIDTLNSKKKSLKDRKESLLMKELEKISSKLASKGFKVAIQNMGQLRGKNIYNAGSTPDVYFAMKKVQYNIRKLYKVQQSNRYNIVTQLKELLKDSVPKTVLRTDIREFYESISRKKLLKKLNEDSLLTLTSKKVIRQLLYEYGVSSKSSSGIPRGIGISPYLSEIYMRHLDEVIRSERGVIYYARYVDDIIVVKAKSRNQDTNSDLRIKIMETLEKEGLTINEGKTKQIEIDGLNNDCIDYLGYNFEFGTGSIELKLTESRIDRYKRKIDVSLQDYIKGAKRNEKKARKLLVKRIKFLTGNTRLVNNKKNALIGVYFSNSLVTNLSDFEELDSYLLKKSSLIATQSLKNLIARLTFVGGFNEKRFHKFTTKDFGDIVRIWKHES